MGGGGQEDLREPENFFCQFLEQENFFRRPFRPDYFFFNLTKLISLNRGGGVYKILFSNSKILPFHNTESNSQII